MKRLRGFIASLLIGFAAAIPAAEPSPGEFTREFVKALKTVIPDRKIEIVKPLEIRIKGNDGDHDVTAYLDNAYNQSLRDPGLKDQIIARYAMSYADEPVADAPIDPARIIPVLKDRAWLADTARALAANGATEPPEYVFEDLNGELVVVYAEDAPRTIRYFPESRLEEAGVKRTELRARATENLMRILPDMKIHAGPLFSMITAGGDFEASLLLVDELWTSGDIEVDGDFVVAVPARDVLLVTGSNNAAGIAKLEELARETAGESSYALTSTLFVYRNGKFETFER